MRTKLPYLYSGDAGLCLLWQSFAGETGHGCCCLLQLILVQFFNSSTGVLNIPDSTHALGNFSVDTISLVFEFSA